MVSRKRESEIRLGTSRGKTSPFCPSHSQEGDTEGTFLPIHVPALPPGLEDLEHPSKEDCC